MCVCVCVCVCQVLFGQTDCRCWHWCSCQHFRLPADTRVKKVVTSIQIHLIEVLLLVVFLPVGQTETLWAVHYTCEAVLSNSEFWINMMAAAAHHTTQSLQKDMWTAWVLLSTTHLTEHPQERESFYTRLLLHKRTSNHRALPSLISAEVKAEKASCWQRAEAEDNVKAVWNVWCVCCVTLKGALWRFWPLVALWSNIFLMFVSVQEDNWHDSTDGKLVKNKTQREAAMSRQKRRRRRGRRGTRRLRTWM